MYRPVYFPTEPDSLGTPTETCENELAGEGQALEFAIGTGRVPVPLRERGIPVVGIEASPAMIAQLRTKVDETTIPVILGGMATTRAQGSYTLVYLVYNTISNLLTQAEQIMCFRNAARHLIAGGRFVIELGVPELRKLTPGKRAIVWHSEPRSQSLIMGHLLSRLLIRTKPRRWNEADCAHGNPPLGEGDQVGHL